MEHLWTFDEIGKAWRETIDEIGPASGFGLFLTTFQKKLLEVKNGK